VSAAVCLYPYTGPIATRGPNSSPLDYIGAHAPPFFIATGSHDALVVPSESRRFAETLRARSREAVVAAELPGAHHCFDLFHSIRCEHVVDAIDSFVTSVTERA
jgi:acetyl esterase/lipase